MKIIMSRFDRAVVSLLVDFWYIFNIIFGNTIEWAILIGCT